jgi:hypothetical protein
MSKRRISYTGKIDMGTQDKINLKTNNGKVGYKITKFQVISTTPGATASVEFVAKIFNKDQTGSINATVDFTNTNLLACAFYQVRSDASVAGAETIIFDNTEFNQNIFVTIADAEGGTVPCNYYLELETMALSDAEATQLTLKNIKTIIAQ